MIVSIGEALIDIKDNEQYVGGCPYNVALTMARQGAPASFLGGISSDSYGSTILNSIIDNCILFDPVFCSSKKRTMTSLAKIENGSVKYSFDWEDTSAFDITFEKLKSVFDVNCGIVCAFFGSVSFTDKFVRNQILSFLKSQSGICKFFDPNVRPFLIKNIKEYRDAVLEASSISQIVKLSEEDLGILELQEGELYARCLNNLIVTHGQNGATWYCKNLDYVVSMPGIHVDNVVDTIGCGDVFSGTVLTQLYKFGKLPEACLTKEEATEVLVKAIEMSAKNCTVSGCNPSCDV